MFIKNENKVTLTLVHQIKVEVSFFYVIAICMETIHSLRNIPTPVSKFGLFLLHVLILIANIAVLLQKLASKVAGFISP